MQLVLVALVPPALQVQLEPLERLVALVLLVALALPVGRLVPEQLQVEPAQQELLALAALVPLELVLQVRPELPAAEFAHLDHLAELAHLGFDLMRSLLCIDFRLPYCF